MKKGLLKSISASAKMKYTTVGIIFTALVIAIVILLNVIISAFASNHRTYIDMTDEQVYSMSDAIKSLMDENFEKTGAQVEIIFPYDKSAADSTTANSYIHSTAKLLEQRYKDNISLSYHDVVRDPDFYRKNNFAKSASSNTIIIAKKNSDGTFAGEYQAYRQATFFSGDENGNLYGYDGEYVFASAIIRLTLEENPIVYFTTGHSEKFEAEKDENGNYILNDDGTPKLKGLATVFEDIGFSVKLLDRETLSQGVPEDARSVVIYDPQFDFSQDEMDKISSYFTQSHGHVMCFVSYDKDFDNLYYNIEALTGIEFNAGDRVNGESNALVRATVPSNDATKKYFPSLLEISANRPVVKNAGYLTFTSNVADGNEYAFGSGIRTIPLLQTTSTTEFQGNRQTRTLMAISSSTRYENMSDYMYSYMLVCPSNAFATEEYLYSNGLYSNRDVILSILQSTTGLQVPINLDTKAFIQYNVDITEKRAAGMTVLMTLLIPALVVVSGTAVIIRRKRR